jgi:hypothetical protein
VRSALCRQADDFIAAGVTHFVLTLSPYDFDVLERFAADVLPRYGARSLPAPKGPVGQDG